MEEKRNFKIVPNDDICLVKEIRRKLIENNGYCPCRIVKNNDTKCMCKEFRDSQEEGLCHCGLYRKVQVGERKDN